MKKLMNLSPKATSLIFILAGCYNLISILGFTKLFTDTTLLTTDPVVFSWVGQASIIFWGLVYWTQTKKYAQNGALVAVFFVEKMLYAVAWAWWLIEHVGVLGGLFGQSVVYGLFFTLYGLGDFVFGVFFGATAIRVLRGDFAPLSEPKLPISQ